MTESIPRRALAFFVLTGLLACGGGPTAPLAPAKVVPDVNAAHLGYDRQRAIELRNEGGRAVGPVDLSADPIRSIDGTGVSGVELVANPAEIPTLNPGSSATVELTLDITSVLPAGAYRTKLYVRSDAGDDTIPVDFSVKASSTADVAAVTILQAPETVRQGDVSPIVVAATDAAGNRLESLPLHWSTIPADEAAFAPGRFVAYDPGPLRLVAAAGEDADTVSLQVTPRGLSGSISVEATAAPPDRITSDLWVHGDAAYTGTWLARAKEYAPADALFVWDVSNPTSPVLADSVIVDARTVNDVKVSKDGRIGVITHEYSKDGGNGVTFLDLSDPLHPKVLSHFTQGLEAGVHNAWLDGDYAYLVVDGVGNGLRILDISDPTNPRVVASYYAGTSFLHDVYVRDGLAFLSHWNAGLVILDVGNGIAGGSPTHPVEVSRLTTGLGPNVHNAWYWPEAGYVFVGQEILSPRDAGFPGIMHVVDVHDLKHPHQVATYSVPDETPHNFWLDEQNQVLYMAWYTKGIRAVDVSGELLGALDREGREITSTQYEPVGECPPLHAGGLCTWAPQLHKGTLYMADMTKGLVVATPVR